MIKIIWTEQDESELIYFFKINRSVKWILVRMPSKSYESIRWKLYRMGLKATIGDKFKKHTYDKPKADIKNRRCLKCSKVFVSYNYLCNNCKNDNKQYNDLWAI